MGECDIIIFSSIKIDKVVGVGYKYRPFDFSYESRWIFGSDVKRRKNQLIYIIK